MSDSRQHKKGQYDQVDLVLWNVPYRRNHHFTVRDELLDWLHQHLSLETLDDPTSIYRVALTQPRAITGLGGIGKTQIAVEYAYRSQGQGHFTHILWINAANKETIIASFMAIAELLSLYSARNEINQYKLVEAVKRWLEQCNQRWLLIFDNADDLPILDGYFPRKGKGSILLTTRANAIDSLAASVEVEKWA
ncbi:MAG TPA: NB-ARC domain-containing protein [Ktedonobacteraceae bacterium]|nr:NB-ARC domain-containing protein [Ktedonobacteraceae bacterium]